MVSSNCTICGGKKVKFIKDQEDWGLLIEIIHLLK